MAARSDGHNSAATAPVNTSNEVFRPARRTILNAEIEPPMAVNTDAANAKGNLAPFPEQSFYKLGVMLRGFTELKVAVAHHFGSADFTKGFLQVATYLVSRVLNSGSLCFTTLALDNTDLSSVFSATKTCGDKHVKSM